MNRVRKPGYYFVMAPGTDYYQPAEWSGHSNSWELIGRTMLFSDGDLTEIDERRIVRDEPNPDNSDAKLLLRFMDAQFRVAHEKWITYRGALSDHDEDVDLRPEVLRMKAGMHELIRIVRELKKEIDPTWSEKKPD